MIKNVLVGVIGEKSVDRVTIASDKLPSKPGDPLLIQRSWLNSWIPCIVKEIEMQGSGEKLFRVKTHYQ
jgi:hypothetical protein